VIGYGFNDSHINNAIVDALTNCDLKLFLVDPAEEKVLDKPLSRVPAGSPVATLADIVQPRIIGMSKRPLSSTFNDDTVEHGNLSSFFQ
jgi:hypothetical protein